MLCKEKVFSYVSDIFGIYYEIKYITVPYCTSNISIPYYLIQINLLLTMNFFKIFYKAKSTLLIKLLTRITNYHNMNLSVRGHFRYQYHTCSTFSNYETDGTEWGTQASYSRTIHPSRNIIIFMRKSGHLCLDNHLMILASSCFCKFEIEKVKMQHNEYFEKEKHFFLNKPSLFCSIGGNKS